jgi:hypothetical protein
MELFFNLAYYLGIDWKTFYNMPVSYTRWLMQRTADEIKEAQKAGSAAPSKGVQHHTPEVRSLAGNSRVHVPSRHRKPF